MSAGGSGPGPGSPTRSFRFTQVGQPVRRPSGSRGRTTMYDRMRADGPVAYGRPYRQWFVFGYDEVQEVLRSPAHGDLAGRRAAAVDAAVPEALAAGAGELRPMAAHRRSARPHPAARRGEPGVHAEADRDGTSRSCERVVDELLDELPPDGEVDIVAAFTSRLPIQVIADAARPPADRRDWLLDASREIGGMLEPLTPFDPAR